MSTKIAPGRWDPILRVAAKSWGKFVGLFLVAVGIVLGSILTKALLLETDREITTLTIVLVAIPSLVPFTIGAMALFPNIVTPLVYRFLAKKEESE